MNWFSGHLLAWLVYEGSVLLLVFLILKPVHWRAARWALGSMLLPLLATPWYVEWGSDNMAPAISIAIFDGFFRGGEAPYLWALQPIGLMMSGMLFVLVVSMSFWGRHFFKSREPKPLTS